MFENRVYNIGFSQFRQVKKLRQPKLPQDGSLLFPEGLAVGALFHSGIHLVGAHHDLVQRAAVLAVAVVSALLDGAFDTLVGVGVHIDNLLFTLVLFAI